MGAEAPGKSGPQKETAQATEGSLTRLLISFALALVALALLPDTAFAWTPGTHIYLGESVLANLHQLPMLVADLLRAFPYDFLYGNIAADTSIAKKYAPVGRHCHAWHVGQEIHDLAPTDPLRAFGLGYLSHLAADTVAHNFFVPRQLCLTSSSTALGHSYWESRFETHLGDAYAQEAKDVILKDHDESDAHLDSIISPTLFSVRTGRRVFRGIVHLTDSESWRWAFQTIADNSRWDLPDSDVEQHMAVAFEYVMGVLDQDDAAARRLDPAGHQALGLAKRMRRETLATGGRTDPRRLLESAEGHFGLPAAALEYWRESKAQRPWRDKTPTE
ncbi:MAG TPA: zinc dependent phospholipase C family protein [Gemmatimonadales bacterium]